MEHIYNQKQFGKINENWFNYQSLYEEMVKKFPSGSHFVEVGSWKGKSTSFMCVEIINSEKNIQFDCVDTWEGSREHQDNEDLFNVYQIFKDNMKPLEGYYNELKMKSMDAVKLYKDESLDFVFIDASHEYEDVKNDVSEWVTKIKKGGVFAGHDYNFPKVNKAVNEILGFKNIQKNRKNYSDCWVYLKN